MEFAHYKCFIIIIIIIITEVCISNICETTLLNLCSCGRDLKPIKTMLFQKYLDSFERGLSLFVSISQLSPSFS